MWETALLTFPMFLDILYDSLEMIPWSSATTIGIKSLGICLKALSRISFLKKRGSNSLFNGSISFKFLLS